MLIENKIGILINWPREVDMYNQLIKIIPKNKIQIIVNDIKGFDKERSGNAQSIKKVLIDNNLHDFINFGDVIGKKKFKVLLSTGESCTHKLSAYSVFKWIYGQLIGRFFNYIKLSILIAKLFKRPFSADGKFSTPFERWFPERIISKISIKYPQGMDLNYIYPDKRWKKHFDIFFTHSFLDSKLIKNKFPEKEIYTIGYPRYYGLIDRKKKLSVPKKFINEVNFNKKKKTILWLPTHLKYKDICGENIYNWVPKLKNLLNRYNIIIRPHPKTTKILSKLNSFLKKENLIIDIKPDRKIGELISYSDLIICDYGGPIFSSLYLEKKIILLNYLNNSRFIKEKIESYSFDIEIRKYLVNCHFDINAKKLENIIKRKMNITNNKKISKIKKHYFGDKTFSNSIEKTSNYLINKLHS